MQVEALLRDAEAETTAEEDATALAQMERGGRGGGGRGLRTERRRKAALLVRLGEKRVLREVLETLRVGLADLAEKS